MKDAMMSLDPADTRALRDAFGAFMTGVTIVTTLDEAGAPAGLTANSFTSVSLDPALLLVCVAGASRTLPAVRASKGFAVNILAEGQEALSNRFAGKAEDRFEDVDWRPGPLGAPILPGVCGWFDCALHDEVAAGDHIILIGRVEGFDHPGGAPLGYAKGGYFTLGR
ncbi:MAG: flavin reductase family protein [Pseudomonadota bacterium]